MKQQSFTGMQPKVEFGGSLLLNKRKTMRPLCTKRPHHLILKAEDLKLRFPGVSFTKVRAKVSKIIKHHAGKHGVSIDSHSVNWNHMHLSIRFKHRINYVRFIRAVTAHVVLELSKHFGIRLKNLFNLRPFTRVVEWGRAYKNLLRYIQINILESEGICVRRKTKTLSKDQAERLRKRSSKRQ